MTGGIELTDADVTPNPDRAIWVDGQLNEALLERLQPEILALTAQNREPITVFIDSRGGIGAERILSLLRRTTDGDGRASRIITVAAPKAHSGGANLLSGGDFAIAYPGSSLLYHGGRWPLRELTGEWARIGRTLATFHEIAAAELARNCIRRFMFIVYTERALFAEHRAAQGDPALTDLDCFQEILRGKLSPAGQEVLELAIPLCASYNGLMFHFRKKLRRGRTVTKEHLQNLMLHASIAFEYESRKGKSAWDGGLGEISEHFYFLNAYFDLERLREWVAGAGPQTAEADDLLEFRIFFLALCRALQEGENRLTALDALWLGLIDTVRAE